MTLQHPSMNSETATTVERAASFSLPLAILPPSLNSEPWSLPGHGKPQEECGKIGFIGCPELALDPAWISPEKAAIKHDIKKFRHSCDEASCPKDYENWSTLAAHRVMERFDAAAKLQYIKHKNLLKHIISSPPRACDAWSIERLRAHSYRALKATGCKGGVSIFHPFRWRCSICGLDEESCECDGESAGVWYWSPHFHIIGHGWIEGTVDHYAKTGWVIKNLGLRANLFATLKYQLSHAGVWMDDETSSQGGSCAETVGKGGAQEEEKGAEEEELGERILPIAKGRGGKKLSITWFGDLAYNMLAVKHEKFEQLCSTCGEKYVILEIDSGFDPPEEGMKISLIEAASYGVRGRTSR